MKKIGRYEDRFVKIELKNGYFYKGKVLDVDEEGSITILDVKGNTMTFNPSYILTIITINKIKEVGENEKG